MQLSFPELCRTKLQLYAVTVRLSHNLQAKLEEFGKQENRSVSDVLRAGPAREVEQALTRVAGVAHVEVTNGDARPDGKYVIAAIRPKEAYDVREEVARTVIQNGWPLREIRLEHATLEEFFIQVTAGQAMAKELKD